MLIILHFCTQYYLRMSVKGGKKAAFGALIRIKCVSVDTTLPTFTGVWTTPGLTSQPKKKRGAEA